MAHKTVYKHIRSHSTLFLMELIMAVFLFTLTCAICVQIFVKAHLLSQQSVMSTSACLFSDSIIQMYMKYGGNLDRIKQEYPGVAIVLEQQDSYTGAIMLCIDDKYDPVMTPASDLTGAANNTRYEVILTTTLTDAASCYSDCSKFSLTGYASYGYIYIFDLSERTQLITDCASLETEDCIYSVPVDLYLGDIDFTD